MNIWQKRAPGVLLCLAVALLAWFLVELAPALEIVGSAVLAILFGMVLCAVMKNKDKVKDGVAFTSQKGAPVRGHPAGLRPEPAEDR